MPLLTCRALTRKFGGLLAIDGLDMVVEQGEILGLIGPNGAGKTTLVNLLAGELHPTSGTIVYKDVDVTGWAPYARNRLGLSRTFQVPKPFTSMTVSENVLLAALFGKGRADHDRAAAFERVRQVLEITGLAPFAESDPGTLGTAGLKRLEVARCLGAEPDLLLLDEPLGGLNPVESQEAIKLFAELNRKGLSIIFIEHIIKAVTAISHRVMVIARGKRLSEGTAAQVLADEAVRRAYLGDVAGALARHTGRSRPQPAASGGAGATS